MDATRISSNSLAEPTRSTRTGADSGVTTARSSRVTRSMATWSQRWATTDGHRCHRIPLFIRPFRAPHAGGKPRRGLGAGLSEWTFPSGLRRSPEAPSARASTITASTCWMQTRPGLSVAETCWMQRPATSFVCYGYRMRLSRSHVPERQRDTPARRKYHGLRTAGCDEGGRGPAHRRHPAGPALQHELPGA
jgi:hypothetical protein